MSHVRILVASILSLCSAASSRAFAFDDHVSGNTEWWDYYPGDIASNQYMRSNFGGFPANGDAAIWTNGWNVAAARRANPPFPEGVERGFLMYGPYQDLEGPGDVEADVYMWACADVPGIPQDRPLLKVELTASMGNEFLDTVYVSGGGTLAPNVNIGFQHDHPKFVVHLQAKNVRDLRNIEVRIAEVNNFTTVEVYSVRLKITRHDQGS